MFELIFPEHSTSKGLVTHMEKINSQNIEMIKDTLDITIYEESAQEKKFNIDIWMNGYVP